MDKIALIGTGALGSPIARRLIRAGFATMIYDVREEALDPLVAMGAKRADSVAECTGSEAILIVVANDGQVEEVVTGPEGVLNNLSADMHPVVVVMSTVLPQTVRRIGEACRGKGLETMDAPVSGSHVAAESGNLSVMVGGTTVTFEKLKPVLSAIGRRLYHVGELGAGETVKLINNMIAVTNMWLTMEALASGVRSGLSLATLLSIIEASSGSNFYIRNWTMSKDFFSDIARDLDSAQNNLSLSAKDLKHAQALLESSGHPSALLAGIIKALGELTPQCVVDQWSAVLE
jgi:3-hydroxyisobutyrate dehydrogenase-like beta-hydroxyacid dehydrogenase